MASTSSSIMDLLEAECPNIVVRRKRNRRRNKHVNPSSQRNLVKPPPPPPKCKLRQPSLIDPDAWVVLVRLEDDEALHEFEEKLPLLAAKAGLEEAILRTHGFTRMIYVAEAEDKKAKALMQVLAPYSPVFVGRTHRPFVRERTLEVHDLPAGIGYSELTEALDCQFPTKSLSYDVLISEDPRQEPEREVLIVTHDSAMFHHLLNNGGVKLFDERLTFRCTERSSEAKLAAGKWKKKKAKVVPESQRQCFKCLAFGHMADGCTAPARCKRCGGPHAHRECPGEAVDEVACVNCGARDHRAVSRSCPLRPGSAQKKRAAAGLKIRPLGGGAGAATSPSPSPSDTGADDSLGAGSCSCHEGADDEEKDQVGEGAHPEEKGAERPSTTEQAAPESRSEIETDDDFVAPEASTEEPRDSPVMASSAAVTASPRDDAAMPDFTPTGVSSTTGEVKPEPKDAEVSCDEGETTAKEEKVEESNPEGDKEKEGEEEVNTSNIEDAEVVKDTEEKREEEEARGTTDESEDEGARHHEDVDDDVLFFTASTQGGGDELAEDAQSCKTATAVAGFFADLFGAAEAPSKPLDGRFVATLRSLQESVYADIVARHPRRGPSSPRERKPAKKRRLADPQNSASKEVHTQTAGAAARSPSASPVPKVLGSPLCRLRAAAVADGAEKPSRGLTERRHRLRVLEQFLKVVNAILEIE